MKPLAVHSSKSVELALHVGAVFSPATTSVQIKAAMGVMIKDAIKIRPIEMNYVQAIKYFNSR
jgi:hypothetical protein